MSLHLRDASYLDLHVVWEKISEFLRRRREDWPAARGEVIALASRLEKSDGRRVDLSAEDMSVLGSVAGALDSECSRLFGKLYRR